MVIDNICIKNEYLTVKISTMGAEMQSIETSDGKEHLHQNDMIFWNEHAPILFPICGRPKDFILNIHDKEFPMTAHGFAKKSIFNLMECTEDLAVFSLVSNEETKKIYPFDFELIVTYKLLGKSIDVSFEVINDSEEEMYFAIGAHEGYNCFGGMENFEIQFEKNEGDKIYIFEGLEIPEGTINNTDHTTINLSKELFREDCTLVIEHPESNFVTLVDKSNGEKIRVEFEDFNNLLIWSAYQSQYVCIEPWCGMADKENAPRDIEKKQDIQKLPAGECFERHHIITIG